MTQDRLPPHEVAELKRLDVAHHLPGQTDYRLQLQLGGSRIITRAEGCTIHDAEGNAMLDGMAGLWCVNAGHGRKEIAQAVASQLETMDYAPPFQMGHPPAFALANAVVKIAPAGLDHVFFTNSGLSLGHNSGECS